MGIVFEARDTTLDRSVAVKVLKPEAATAAAAHRFLREARLLARLRHPNIVQVHQAGEGDGLFWFTMDFVTGETLAARLSRGALPSGEALSVAGDLLAALAAAHDQGIVHRDIKPSNIFLEKGRALLADFGIARTLTTSDPEEGVTLTREVIGTPAYMAPERMSGEPVGPAADIYSMGLVLYECFTGRRWPPLQSVASGDWSGVPGRVVPTIRRALASEPGGRWPNAAAFAASLTSKRRRWPWVVVTAAVAVAVFFRPLPEPPAEDGFGPGSGALPSSSSGQRAWQRAEKLYASGSWKKADDAYRAVLTKDSACLACEFRMLDLDRWLEQRPDSESAARVYAERGKFSEPWRQLIIATRARLPERIENLKQLSTDYRDWDLAQYYYGTELFNRGALFGHARREALEALSQVAPAFAPVMTDMTLVRIAEGDSASADSALQRLQKLPPAEGLAQAQRLLAGIAFSYRFTNSGDEAWIMAQQDSKSLAIPELAAGPRVLPGLGTPAGAVSLGRQFERGGQPKVQRSGLIAEMFGNAALGNIDSLQSARNRLNATFPSPSLDAFGVLLDAAMVVLDDATPPKEVGRVVTVLRDLTRPVVDSLARRDAAWLLAMAALRRNDPIQAKDAWVWLKDEPEPAWRRTFVSALLLAASGRQDSALKLTDAIINDLDAWDRERSPFLRAGIMLSRAKWHEAVRALDHRDYFWPQHFHLHDYPTDEPLPAEGDWAFETLASWKLARLLDRGSFEADACASYRIVAERWASGAPVYRARADSARQSLTALHCAARR